MVQSSRAVSAGPGRHSASNRGASNKSAGGPSIMSVLCLIPTVVVFFCLGVYLGSQMVDDRTAAPLPRLGLPGTKNNFIKWDNAANDPSSSATKYSGVDYQQQQQQPQQPAAVSLQQQQHDHNLRSVDTPQQQAKVVERAIPPVGATSNLRGALTKKVESKNPKRSLHISHHSSMTGPSNLDDKDLLIGAWIYLDPTETFDNNMRTIFSNKQPGCERSPRQNGIALFVNGWEQRDHKLYVEYGGEQSGCHKLQSVVELHPGWWYHVAVHCNEEKVSLFIDGQQVGMDTVAEPHVVQTSNPLMVGVFNAQHEYPLYGNVSNLAVVHGASKQPLPLPEIVKSIGGDGNIIDTPGIVALYRLHDGADEVPFSKAVDEVGHRSGEYTFPNIPGRVVTGVRIPLVDGLGKDRIVTEEMRKESDEEGRRRRESVKMGMKHAWEGYKKYAWGRDEVKPKSHRGSDNWGGMGVTLVDSLDTLWVMGMKTEFYEARDWVEKSLTFNNAGSVSVFETTIRELGGLLSAYDLSGEQVFLKKAKELADKLMPAFETQSGIPTGQVNMRSGSRSGGWSGGNAILSELGSLQIEFRYLAHHTHEQKYERKSMRPMQIMHSKTSRNGLYPIKVSQRDGSFADSQITFGALGDSFYEYLLKIWVQGGRKENWLREMYDRAIDGAIEKLLLASDITGLAFLSDWNGRFNNRKMDHLVCFMPGTMALGAYTDPRGIDSERARRDLAVAKALMYTCREMYHRTATGISAEYVEFPPRSDFIAGRNAGFYILRPETAESLFYLNQLTGDPIYRDWAWEIWQAIDHTCRTDIAYGAIRNVNAAGGGGIDDRMESFFLAETMKYLYLALDPDNEIDLTKYVFNTEAHPMKIFDDSHVPVQAT